MQTLNFFRLLHSYFRMSQSARRFFWQAIYCSVSTAALTSLFTVTVIAGGFLDPYLDAFGKLLHHHNQQGLVSFLFVHLSILRMEVYRRLCETATSTMMLTEFTHSRPIEGGNLQHPDYYFWRNWEYHHACMLYDVCYACIIAKWYLT